MLFSTDMTTDLASVELMVQGSITFGYPATYDDPGCSDEIEDFGVFMYINGKTVDITSTLDSQDISVFKDYLIDDYRDYLEDMGQQEKEYWER